MPAWLHCNVQRLPAFILTVELFVMAMCFTGRVRPLPVSELQLGVPGCCHQQAAETGSCNILSRPQSARHFGLLQATAGSQC